MNWIEKCKELPVGGTKRVQCCGSDRSRILRNEPEKYSSGCFRSTCPDGYVSELKSPLKRLTAREEALDFKEKVGSEAIPKDTVYDLPQEAIAWLSKAGIHQAVYEKYKFGWSPSVRRVVVPIWMEDELVGSNNRALQENRIKYMNMETRKGLLFTARMGSPVHKTVVLTEDILSAIRLQVAVDRAQLPVDVISILGTSVNLSKSLYVVKNYDRVHVWLDGDKAGYVGQDKWLHTLKPYVPCTISNKYDGMDPKDFTDEELINILKEKLKWNN